MDIKVVYSANQKRFIKAAEKAGLTVSYDYSGRGMYGKTCPCVRLDNLSEWPGNPYKYNIDNMGKGYVIYAQK